MKQYDRAYFDKWYRSCRNRVSTSAEVRRKAAMAIAVAEYFLRRPVRSVLDIGAGEGSWGRHLQALRPKISYQGIDPSDYAVRRFGQSRNIRRGTFGSLDELRLTRKFDLVVCADVLHYVPDAEIRTGLSALVPLAGALAFIEVLTSDDDVVGDLQGFIRRPPSWYRRTFERAGFRLAGPYCWTAPALRDEVSALEASG